jgi:hypothetical protein
VSPRVKGDQRDIPEVDCDFHACTKQTIGTIRALASFRNPFVRSDEEMAAHPDRHPRAGGQIGYLRRWAVFDYAEIEENKGWGFSLRNTRGRLTICYKDGVLGVALRKPSGRTLTVNSMTAFKSMYAPRV